MFKLDLEKAEELEIKLPTYADHRNGMCWIMEKAREFQKSIYFCYIDYAKAFDCMDHSKLWKIIKDMDIPNDLMASWETCMQDKKQLLVLDMEQWTGSKLGKEYIKGDIVTLLFKLICREHHEKCQVRQSQAGIGLLGEISITSDM